MKTNEIGHFPYCPPVNQYDNGGHPRTILTYDENKNIVWKPNWKIIGEVELIDFLHIIPFENKPLVDLQTNQECYYADIFYCEGETYIRLIGSGWADDGFPFYDDTIDVKDLYATGKGSYAFIRGKAKDNFIAIAKNNGIPSFRNIFTGDYKKDFVLPKIKS
jgi:hypothetical protein